MRKADVINISRAAYKGNSSNIMDASNYSPASAKDTITVATVKNDKTLDKTSNYGEVVDYVAYGSLEVGGMNGEISVSDGTSVSAAIVSGVAADVIADGNNDYASAVKAMDALDK